uniref:Microtubule-associated protein futsch-like n=1 Tax=Saccoglossus kowalevskii TaxID=10224 RepID=A0ABM0MN56_SACKO|nr:PREDICTED: microtubule-associated protein futsch-like [Saccoglossus kowalevskii]
MITPRLSSTTPSTLFVNSVSPRITEYSDDLSAEEAELEEEHARYVEMFQPQEPPEPRQESSLSIIEITEPVDAYGLEEATCYSVQEGSDPEIIVENLVDQPQKEIMAKKSVKQPVKPNSSRPSSRVKPGKKHKDEDKVTNKTFDSEEKSSHRSQSRTERKVGKERVKSRNEKRPGSRSKSVTSIREENKHSSASSAVTMTTSRPSSSARPPSAGITSQPSLGLQQISQQRVQSRHTYKKESLADFFMAGVNDDDDAKGDQNKDVATPSGDKLTEEKVEYKGGPALWRPLSSLSCHLEDIKPDFVTGQDFGITDFLTGPSSSNLERTHRISSTEPPKWPLNTPPPATWDDEEEFDLVQKKLASMPRPPTLPESTTPNSAKMRNINSAKRERLSAQKRDTDTSKKDRPSSGSGRRLPSVNKNVNVNERQSATHRKSTDVKKRGRRSLPPRPPSRPSSSRPCSRIDVDGDDMSRYDHDNEKILQNEEDDETLHQLEWELASQDGRITADGNISRMSMLDDIPDEDINSDLELGIKQDIGMGSGLSSPCDDFDIEKRLSEEDLMDDFEETERLIMADEVKNLES